MLLLLVAVVVGGSVGLLRAPTGAHTSRPVVRRMWLVALGVVLYASALLLDGGLAILVMAASLTALIAAASANRHLTGVVVVGLGLLLNLTALVLNNGMSVRQIALERAGVVAAGEAATLSGAQHLETRSDAFGVLGDVLPVSLTREVLSFGDLIVILGAADAVRELARRQSRPWTPRERAAYRVRTAAASEVQDWGRAPRPAPVSAFQYSANPDDTAPLIIELDNERATSGRRELVAASHRR